MRMCIILVAFVCLTACAPSRFVEPLEKKSLAVGASIGGPVIEFAGAPIPLPMSSIEVGYGLDSNLTVHGAWHTTAALFGNAQIDAGVTYRLLHQQKFRPNLSVSPSFNFIYNFEAKSARLWPILDLNAYWNYGQRKNYFYVGVNNYFELKKTMAHEQEQAHHWIFSPQIGHVFKGKKRPWQLFTEFKFIAPNVDNSFAFVPYQSILGKWGATGFYLGYRYTFSKK
ncbi:MAG: hypothetical protein WDZ35_05600 [Crocinitomicaceae bacterium]